MTLTRFVRTRLLARSRSRHSAPAQQDLRATLFAEADRALAQARAANAELLAPGDVRARHAKPMRPPRATSRAAATWSEFAARSRLPTRAFTEAGEAAEIANVTLASVIKTRADAANANAATFAAELWTEASEAFDSAARRLETGDIRGARGRADEAEALYRDAELTAIKAQYLSQTRALLAEAEQARVPRLAPRTYEKAQSLLARGRARAQREPLRHRPAAQPRAASQLRSAARDLSRGPHRPAARRGPDRSRT